MTDSHGYGTLIAVDGLNGAAVRSAAKKAIAATPRARRGGVSAWDASGIFGELIVADVEAGQPSVRTLLLLYAADLAFRLRWEIRPALEEGRTVAAAPYVATAIAFGRAAGLPGGWLRNVFAFAPRPDETRLVSTRASTKPTASGFVDFACHHVIGNSPGLTRRALTDRARAHLAASARR